MTSVTADIPCCVFLALGDTLQACAPHKLHFLQDQQVTLVKSLTETSLIVQNCELKWVCLTIGTYRYPQTCWFIMVYVGLSWFMLVYHGLWWFMMVYPGLSWFIMVYDGLSSFSQWKSQRFAQERPGCTTYPAVPEGPASICAQHQVVAWQCLAGCTLSSSNLASWKIMENPRTKCGSKWTNHWTNNDLNEKFSRFPCLIVREPEGRCYNPN